MESKTYDVLIIGGGIIGSSIAYQLSKSKLNTILIEKNMYLADETSMGNSGIIHSGFDAEGQVESRLNLAGNKIWRNEILKNIKIPYSEIPSLILAFNDMEDNEVKKLYARGIKNKLDPSTIKILTHDEIVKIEPHVNKKVTSGLISTTSIAVDPVLSTRGLIGVAKQNGLEVIKGSKIESIVKNGDIYEVADSSDVKYYAKNIINCSGHFADEIANKSDNGDFKLSTRRGEYRILAKSEAHKVNNVVFKVPTIHGKGVIAAPMLDGRVMIGPTAEDGVPKDDTGLVTREKYDLIGEIGNEIITDIDISRTERIYSGSRPIYKKTNDFLIGYGKTKNFINVAGIQSPGLSSAPAIALDVENLLKNNGTKINRKDDFKNKFEVIW